MRIRLQTTTALVACLSLGLQAPAFAQGNGVGRALGLAKQSAKDLGLSLCTEADAPCVTEENLVLLDAPALDVESCVDPIVVPCRREDGFALVAPEGEEAKAILATGTSVPAEDQPTAQADVMAEESESTEEAESATADATVAAEAEAPAVESEAEPATDTTEAVADTQVADQPAEEASVAQTEGTAVPDPPVDQTSEASTPTEPTAAAAESTPPAETAQDQPVVVETPPASAAAAATSGDGDQVAEGAEVTTEEVTEDTARSATEDFKTSAAVTTERASAGDDKDSGLSNFERALLLGIGAVAVGSILDNGSEVVSNSGDRVVIRGDDGNLQVLKDDAALLRQPGSQVRTERFNDGSSRTVVTREDGSRVITILAADGSVVRRSRIFADGSEVVLFDDTREVEPVIVSELPAPRPQNSTVDATDEDALRAALAREMATEVNRGFSLRQIRNIREVRELAPEIDLDAITFRSGSAAIDPSQAGELAALGRAMARIITERPWELFLIEGHTDAVGDATYNLALSDRRAESVALALTQFFDVPPENMIVQGYGESFLKIDTLADERLNRRATVRRITPLLQTASR